MIVVCVDRRSLIIVNTISRGYFVEWFSGVGMVVGKVLLIVELVQQQQCPLTSLFQISTLISVTCLHVVCR